MPGRISRQRRRTLGLVATLTTVALAACAGGDVTAGGRGPPRPTSPAPPPTAPAPAPTSATSTVATPAVTSTTAASAPVAHSGPFAVGVHVVTFVDDSRPTPATSAGRSAPSRTVPTTIWYPAQGADTGADGADARPATASGPFPLVVWAHGFSLSGPDYRSLLHRWASAGYVIAAPDFPSSTGGGGRTGEPSTDDEASEPGDLGFTATSVARLSAGRAVPLAGLVDSRRLIVAGHSQGAVDALAVTLAACCRDTRVTAAVIVAGIDLPGLFGAYQYATTRAPVLIEQGGQDPHLSVAGDRSLYSRLGSPKALLVMPGEGHNTSKGDAGAGPTRLLAQAVVDFCDRYVKGAGDRARLGRDVAASALAELSESP